MTAAAVPALVRAEDLRVGPLLAEGGEGKVFLLPRQPHLLFKTYRRAVDREHLRSLVAWPEGLETDRAERLQAAAAWPTAVVTGGGAQPVGLLVPRAPRRFAVRHRDGRSRLASLSYLTADPGHRAAAYGLELPAPGSVRRIGLVHALARLLTVFESASPSVGHGDLSTKNVLWSLQRGPEVFVIDCDNAEFFGPDGLPIGDSARRRAMTPNWDDPAVPRGSNPTLESDRYSLALIFLRLVGAANYPVQARQRSGGQVRVDIPVPPGTGADALLDRDAPIWDLCARSLSVEHPEDRPPASEWVGELERVLTAMGAQPTAAATGAPLGQAGAAAATIPVASRPSVPEVEVVPVRAEARPERTWSKVSPAPRYPAGAAGSGSASPSAQPGAGGFAWRPLGALGAGATTASPTGGAGSGPAPGVPAGTGGPGAVAPGVITAPAMWDETRQALSRALRWWLALHRSALRSLVDSDRRHGPVRALSVCAVVDTALGLAALFLVATVVTALIGI